MDQRNIQFATDRGDARGAGMIGAPCPVHVRFRGIHGGPCRGIYDYGRVMRPDDGINRIGSVKIEIRSPDPYHTVMAG
ncbi:hypothetical protein Geu3261_0027_004 [Komagataeibacter europaeus NBRC 3261]|uniref:Uncharacterized protein n=1 Tax=Komagataeibacter europaeus NBRC 3261 TaxID=1234669 RepID=A0A0D6PWE5_KOMEU|nr:hypothetical protein Geu3261_0027_004 [Komagataeibacter europaeus NBRC 3261]